MIGRAMLGVVLLATLAVAGCAAYGEELSTGEGCKDVLVPSELRALGTACDGERIVVRGLLRVGPEMRGLWDSLEDIDRANYRAACITVYNPHGAAMDGPIRLVEVSGRFHASRPARLFILGACSDAILEIEAVRDLPQ